MIGQRFAGRDSRTPTETDARIPSTPKLEAALRLPHRAHQNDVEIPHRFCGTCPSYGLAYQWMVDRCRGPEPCVRREHRTERRNTRRKLRPPGLLRIRARSEAAPR